MHARSILFSGVFLIVVGWIGLWWSCPALMSSAGLDGPGGWPSVPFDLRSPVQHHFEQARAWGTRPLVFWIALLAGVPVFSAGLSLAHRRLAWISGWASAILGCTILVFIWPTLEAIAYTRGHAMLEEMPKADIVRMARWLHAFHVAEFLLVTGVSLLVVRCVGGLAAGCLKRAFVGVKNRPECG